MSLAHALLVSLVTEPKSGYDLAKQFDGSVGFFWEATHQQIYRELTKLEQQNWISSEIIAQEGRPDKKVFSVTAVGLTEMTTWLKHSTDTATVKDEFLLKVYAGHLVDKTVIMTQIQQHREIHAQKLQTYQVIEQHFFANLDDCPYTARFAYLTLRRGIAFEQGWVNWCDEALSLLASWTT